MSTAAIQTETMKIIGDTLLDTKIYLPAETGPCPGIVLSHGFASCKEEFMELPEQLAKAGYVVITFDYSGHGKSSGDRGYVSYQGHLDDLVRVYQELIRLPQVDVYKTALIGHSLGTSSVLRFLGTSPGKQISCAVVLAPPHQIRQNVTPFEKMTYAMLYSLSLPLFTFARKHIYIPYPVSLEDLYVSSDAVKKAQQNNFLMSHVSVNNYSYAIEKQDNVIAAEGVETPTLVMAAEMDQLIPVEHSKRVYDAINSEQKEWDVVMDSGHSMLGDHHSQEVIDKILSFLGKYF